MTALVLHLPLPPPLSACFKNARCQKRIGGKLKQWTGRVKTARYEAWIDEAGLALRAELREPRCWPSFPISTPVRAEYQFGRPDKRRADVANKEKAVSDLLVRAGILVDDSQIVDLRLRWANVDGVVITIRPAQEAT